MLAATTESLATIAGDWLARFEQSLVARDQVALASLFHADSHWRDVLALTWDIRTVTVASTILPELATAAANHTATNFRIDPKRTLPRQVTRAGTDAIEAMFTFETTEARCNGVVRLTADGGTFKAWNLVTAIDEIKGHEEHIGRSRRPTGEAYARDFRGPNWLDLRNASAAYTDRDPDVVIVGGGQAGLSIAARLKALDIDALIVDREPRIGDNWRKRYHALTLHNQVHVNHLPYMPFPPSWPAYIPKDKLANWFEAYVEALELNYWTGTELTGGSYDETAQRWSVTLRRADGSERTMRPRHVVMATGVSGIPALPDIPSLKDFAGTVLHSGRYEDGEEWNGKNALVIGTGNSGHDIAQDLHSAGANVTLVQRSPTLIVNIEPSAQLAYALYDEGPPLEDCDLITVSVPLDLARKSHQRMTAHCKQLDKNLLDRLARVGFKLSDGEDGTGWQFLYLTRGGGYYFNVGCSDLIADEKIRLLQFADIEGFTRDGARLRSGKTLPLDLVVTATGYKGQEALVRKLFGEKIADRVGPIWGFGDTQELRNMFVRTPQPGLWFIAGSLAQCRIYSKYLALQIKGGELGLVPASQPSAASSPSS